jgi:hydrogenase maturation protease
MGAREILILGIGNPLLGDDGFGVEVVRRLGNRAGLGGVEVLDGGASGLYLLPYLEGKSHILVIDAINFGGVAGQMIRFRADEVPAFLGAKLSEHQVTFHEVLALMKLLKINPKEFLFIGVQPVASRWGDALSPDVEMAIDNVIGEVLDQVRIWKTTGQPS